MRRREFLTSAAVGAASVVGLTAQGTQAPAPGARQGGAGDQGRGGGGGRGRGPAPVAPAKLARVSLMTLDFNAYLRNPNNQNPTPEQTMTPFDLPKMYVEMYGVHNIEYQHTTIVQSETDPAYIKELKAKLDENQMTMRGIVTLAAALAFPFSINGTAFPFRDLIVLTAFAVVLGTLVIQGLTLGPLLRAFNLSDDDPVEREISRAREHALNAALATLDGLDSDAARAVRQEFVSHLRQGRGETADREADHERIHQSALAAARHTIFEMRERDEIGDDAFHRLEQDFDWMEMANATGENL